MTLLTTQEERERSLKDRVVESDRKWRRVAEEERDRLRDLLREARGFLVYFTDITRPAAGFSKGYPKAADLISRIDKEIGNG